MKQLLLALLAIAFLAVGCSNDNEDMMPEPEGEEVLTFFKYTFLGETIEEDSLSIGADNLVAGTLNLQLISGQKELQINIAEFDDMEGTYFPNFIQLRDGNDNYYGDTGTVEVTEINREEEYISGTFELRCAVLGGDEVDVTNGEFTMDYN